jgi:hypothetical protein
MLNGKYYPGDENGSTWEDNWEASEWKFEEMEKHPKYKKWSRALLQAVPDDGWSSDEEVTETNVKPPLPFPEKPSFVTGLLLAKPKHQQTEVEKQITELQNAYTQVQAEKAALLTTIAFITGDRDRFAAQAEAHKNELGRGYQINIDYAATQLNGGVDGMIELATQMKSDVYTELGPEILDHFTGYAQAAMDRLGTASTDLRKSVELRRKNAEELKRKLEDDSAEREAKRARGEPVEEAEDFEGRQLTDEEDAFVNGLSAEDQAFLRKCGEHLGIPQPEMSGKGAVSA